MNIILHSFYFLIVVPLWLSPPQHVTPAWPPPVPVSSHAAPRSPTPAGNSSSAPSPARCTAGGTHSSQPIVKAHRQLLNLKSSTVSDLVSLFGCFVSVHGNFVFLCGQYLCFISLSTRFLSFCGHLISLYVFCISL